MKKTIFVVCVLVCMLVALLGIIGAKEHDTTLTIIHSSDGESALLENDYSGSVAQFATVVRSIVNEVGRDNSLVVSSGDNFLAGLEYAASEGVYDARALSHIGFDASAIGNHEFDYGPEGMERFITNANFPFISSNLDVTPEPALRRFAGTRVLSHTIIEKGGTKIGLVGATTPKISYISSPGKVAIKPLRESLQSATDALRADGVDIIVALTHLQNIEEEKELASQINGIDVFIAGGGDDLIGNENNAYLVRTDSDGNSVQDTPIGEYPFRAIAPNGEPVVVVSTDGSYNYVGRLDLEFDKNGIITAVGDESGPIGVGLDVVPDSKIQSEIVDVVAEEIQQFSTVILGTTVDGLDGTRETVRTQESTMGNAIADGYLYSANLRELGDVDFSFTNGGGIRRSVVVEKNSEVNRQQVLTALPFANYLTIVTDMSAEEIKALFEYSVAELPEAAGRFLQVAGISVTYNSTLPAGSRVQSISIGGEQIVSNGEAVSANKYSGVTNSFLAGGGDGYAVLRDIPNTRKIGSGYSYAQGFEIYLQNNSPIASPVGGRLIDISR